MTVSRRFLSSSNSPTRLAPFMQCASLRSLLLLVLLLAGPIAFGGCAQEQAQTTGDTTDVSISGNGGLLDSSVAPAGEVPFVESPEPVVNKMLELAEVGKDDVVYDLGSGDGRIVISAAKQYGARGVGIEIKPRLVEQARKNAKQAGVSDRVTFKQGDLFKADISDATVVTLYLLPSVNNELRPKLFRELKPGTRVVSHDFDMDEWEPDTTWRSDGETVYRWTIPEDTPSFLESGT